MTQLDVVYSFGAQPSEQAILALSKVRDVYGVRYLELSETARTIRVEYDASRLTESVIHQLLRRAGLDLRDKVVLFTPPTPPAESAPVAS